MDEIGDIKTTIASTAYVSSAISLANAVALSAGQVSSVTVPFQLTDFITVYGSPSKYKYAAVSAYRCYREGTNISSPILARVSPTSIVTLNGGQSGNATVQVLSKYDVIIDAIELVAMVTTLT